ncbi:MAG: hypothetical protein K6F77_07715 [Lachnospiraceae bacterium]|nr:hypothetical protein [Lachnospiraceae bacterium]
MSIDGILISEKKIYRIFTVLEALIKNINNIEKLTYEDLMRLTHINSKKSIREYLFFIDKVLGGGD